MLFDPEALLPIAYRAASQVVHSPVLAEEDLGEDGVVSRGGPVV